MWYGGGKLAADLTWPRLCQRWTGPARPADHALTAAERNAWWEHAARAADQAAAHIRALAGPDPAAAGDAAWAASDTLHVAAAMLGSRILAQAADAYDRAARAPYGRIPQPTPAGNRLRQAARIMAAFAYLADDRTLNPIILITRLAALAEAVAELRDSQQRAAQAAAARAAAERLYAAARPTPAAGPQAPPRARTTADLAATSFPGPASTTPPPAARTGPARRGPGSTAPGPQTSATPATRPQPLNLDGHGSSCPCGGQSAGHRSGHRVI